jgi:hypothetical protein
MTVNEPISSVARNRQTSATISPLVVFASPARRSRTTPEWIALPEDEFAEVLVSRHENGAPAVRLSQDLVISDAGRQLRHVHDVMAVLA